MIVIKNNILPVKGYKAMTLWPFLFIRKDASKFTDVDENHENIHGRQQLEMLILPFLLWYIIEWMIRKVFGKGNAYRNISFEREAYGNEANLEYLKKKKFYAWVKYIKNTNHGI